MRHRDLSPHARALIHTARERPACGLVAPTRVSPARDGLSLTRGRFRAGAPRSSPKAYSRALLEARFASPSHAGTRRALRAPGEDGRGRRNELGLSRALWTLLAASSSASGFGGTCGSRCAAGSCSGSHGLPRAAARGGSRHAARPTWVTLTSALPPRAARAARPRLPLPRAVRAEGASKMEARG